MSCNSHSPPLSQTGQSSGWLVSRNSSVPLRACCTIGESVWTTMPSATGKRAADLQLGGLFDFHQAHAAGGLQREAVVIAEGGDFDAGLFGGVDDQRSRRRGNRLAVDCEIY